jgi:RNA polymerase sigma-70 factor (ECF subfamily)
VAERRSPHTDGSSGATVALDFGDQLVALLPRLRRFAYGLTGSVDEGDDVVQSACERALQKADQFAPGSRFDSWMYCIVQTVWIDRIRKKSRLERGVDPADLAQHSAGDAVRAQEDRLALAEARRAIARLPAEQREVLMLVSVEGMGYRQAAEVLGVPIGTVMSRLSRGRIALAKTLEAGAPRAGATVIRFGSKEGR